MKRVLSTVLCISVLVLSVGAFSSCTRKADRVRVIDVNSSASATDAQVTDLYGGLTQAGGGQYGAYTENVQAASSWTQDAARPASGTTTTTTTRPAPPTTTTTRPTPTTTRPTPPTTTTRPAPTTTTTHPAPTTKSCDHDWAPATCTTPETCRKCGMTWGDPNGHIFAPATCTRPRKCRTCGTTVGVALGHSYDSTGLCTRCGIYNPDVVSTEGPTRTPEEFYQLLCSDSWVEINSDLSKITRCLFYSSGRAKLTTNTTGGQYYETVLTNRKTLENGIQYIVSGYAEYNFIDIGSNDVIHCQIDAVCTTHRMLIRESKLSEGNLLTQQIAGTQWKSAWFTAHGVNIVRMSDFDIYPINDSIVHVAYRSTINDLHVEATLIMQKDGTGPNVYIETTNTRGTEPEMEWHVEKWNEL